MNTMFSTYSVSCFLFLQSLLLIEFKISASLSLWCQDRFWALSTARVSSYPNSYLLPVSISSLLSYENEQIVAEQYSLHFGVSKRTKMLMNCDSDMEVHQYFWYWQSIMSVACQRIERLTNSYCRCRYTTFVLACTVYFLLQHRSLRGVHRELYLVAWLRFPNWNWQYIRRCCNRIGKWSSTSSV